MGWGSRYTLPWTGLDRARVEEASRDAAKQIGAMRWAIESSDPNGLTCFFEIAGEEAFRRELRHPARLFREKELIARFEEFGQPRDAPIALELRFVCEAGQCTIEWETTWSGNGVTPSVIMDLGDAVAATLGAAIDAG